jgi:glycosyltransferase involved in cell wall biosynthesis
MSEVFTETVILDGFVADSKRAELISCVMATKDRPRFVRQALRCFHHQKHSHCELIVVDDGRRPVGKLCQGANGVTYIRLSRPTPTGTKLNVGIEAARGMLIQKLDDDDYYNCEFLEISSTRLSAGCPDRALVAWDCFLVFIAGEGTLRESGHGWTAGGTFCFHREMWRRTPFRDVAVDEDAWFLIDHQPEIIPVCAPDQYVLLVRHGRNTWNRMEHGEDATAFLRRWATTERSLDTVFDAESERFYRSLRWGGETPSGRR